MEKYSVIEVREDYYYYLFLPLLSNPLLSPYHLFSSYLPYPTNIPNSSPLILCVSFYYYSPEIYIYLFQR